MNVLWVLSACYLVQLACCYDPDFYKGYQKISVVPETLETLEKLHDIEMAGGLDFWDSPSLPGREVTLLVGPDKLDYLRERLHAAGLQYTVVDEDVSRILHEEWARLSQKEQVYDYADFNTLTDIYTELDNLASQCHADFVCTTSSIGTSIEGREIRMLEIRRSGTPNTEAFFMDSTTHAREWLAPSTTMNIFRDMITNYPAGDTATLMSFNWYFVPLVNPDGYEYTWTDQRYWRKNRRDNLGTTCDGVDLNRNFDFEWSEPGAGSNPCDETYYGSGPASEPETAAIQNTVLNIAQSDNLRTLWTVHTYGHYMLYPYGNCALTPPNVAELIRKTTLICDAIESTYNTNWACGQMCPTLYETSGITIDWAYDSAGVDFPWTPELRGNDFVVPVSEIPLSFEEVRNGLVALCEDVLANP